MHKSMPDNRSRMVMRAMENLFLTSAAGEPFRQPYQELETAYEAVDASYAEFWEHAEPMFMQFVQDHGGGEE